VPRLFEKVYDKTIERAEAAGKVTAAIAYWAIKVAEEWAALASRSQRVGWWLNWKHKLAIKLVFSKWRAAMGGRIRYFISGGAPLSSELAHIFYGAGIPILQGYGMTETCIVCANRPEDNCVGSIGKPFKGIEVAIAGDGEILVRGPNVMRGYYGKPEATLAVMRGEWFATGDVGHIDDAGHIFITDRKKDLFKLSNGKYIAPQQIESLLKQSEFVNQVVVIGASRKYPAALIVPDWEALKSALCAAGEPATETHEVIAKQTAAVKIVQLDVTKITAHLADYERVRRVALLPNEFSIDSGEMTPTLKVKRNVIDDRYAKLIEELYRGA